PLDWDPGASQILPEDGNLEARIGFQLRRPIISPSIASAGRAPSDKQVGITSRIASHRFIRISDLDKMATPSNLRERIEQEAILAATGLSRIRSLTSNHLGLGTSARNASARRSSLFASYGPESGKLDSAESTGEPHYSVVFSQNRLARSPIPG